MCQCPESGKPHFYAVLSSYTTNVTYCVNALSRANLISTEVGDLDELDAAKCQCPESGKPHFYVRIAALLILDELCQCPESGKPHFYRLWKEHQSLDNKCVNALSRANLISTLECLMDFDYEYIVSMP